MKKIIDGSLDQIHEIQEKHYLERRSWNWGKEKKYYSDLLVEIAKEIKVKLVRTKSGTLRFNS